MNPVHISWSYFFQIHLNIILPFCLGLPGGISPSGLLAKTCTLVSAPHVCHMPHPSHSPCFDHPSNIWLMLQIIRGQNKKYRKIMEWGQADSWRSQCLEALHGCPMLHKE
jgi:hypothetical protein